MAKLKDIRYVLFDLDGTLTDPKEGITKCVQYALSKFGIEADTEDLLPFIGPPLYDSFPEYYGLNREDTEKAVAYYRERFHEVGMFENIPYEGMTAFLKELKENGFITAVATSKPEEASVIILKHFGFAPYFDVISGSNPDGTKSKKTELMEDVRLRLSIDKEDFLSRAVMVGDRRFDIEGAKSTGIRSIGVSYGYAAEGELEAAGADYIVGSVEELRSLFFD